MSFARLPNPPPGYDKFYFERLLNELNLQFRDMHNAGAATHTTLQLTALPTSPAGLRVGEVWIDTAAGNALKVVL